MKQLIPCVLVAILFLSCNKNKNSCSYNPCTVSAPAAEITAVESYLTANSITATKHCSGFYYIIDVPGTGPTPTICSVVSVKYKGQLSNGTIFDQATTAVSFNLNVLIEAWKKALLQVKSGGKIRMWVPPSLAYGSQDVRNASGAVIIPGNSMLIFEVELVGIL